MYKARADFLNRFHGGIGRSHRGLSGYRNNSGIAYYGKRRGVRFSPLRTQIKIDAEHQGILSHWMRRQTLGVDGAD